MAAGMEGGVLDLISVHVSMDLLALSMKEVREGNKEGNFERFCTTRQHVHI